MKRPPEPGQPTLRHFTVNSRHEVVLALTVGQYPTENYDVQAIQVARQMLETGEEVGGFTTRANGLRFWIEVDGEDITDNRVSVFSPVPYKDRCGLEPDFGSLRIDTKILPAAGGMSLDFLRAAADLEQCIAIAIMIDSRHKSSPAEDRTPQAPA